MIFGLIFTLLTKIFYSEQFLDGVPTLSNLIQCYWEQRHQLHTEIKCQFISIAIKSNFIYTPLCVFTFQKYFVQQ